MSNARIRQGVILALLAASLSGCSTWVVPRVAVEDRWVPPVERPKVHRVKNAAPARMASKAPAQSSCDGYTSSLIHPLHFGGGGTDQCPLLQWEIRLTRP